METSLKMDREEVAILDMIAISEKAVTGIDMETIIIDGEMTDLTISKISHLHRFMVGVQNLIKLVTIYID